MNQIFIRVIAVGALAIGSFFAFSGLKFSEVEKVTAEEKSESVLIVASSIRSDGWENLESSKLHDLSENALFQDFNLSNSAYVVSSNYRLTHPVSSSSIGEVLPSAEKEKVISDPSAHKIEEPEIPEEHSVETESPEETPIDTPVDSEPTPEPAAEQSTPETIFSPEPPLPSEPSLESSVFDWFFSLKAQAQEEEMENSLPSHGSSESYDRFKSCDDDNSECLSKSIEFDGFGIADAFTEKPVKNIQLRFSLGAAAVKNQEAQIPGRVLIEYYFNEKWKRAGEILVADEVSNALNGGYFLYALPEVTSWQELDNLKIRLKLQYFGQAEMDVFLDGLWLEADADLNEPELTESVILQEGDNPEFDIEILSSSKSFDTHELPSFSFNYKKDKGTFDLLSSFFSSLIGRSGVVFEAVDQKISVNPEIITEGNNFKISFANSRFFIPGRHKLKIKVNDGGSEYRHEHEFLWGAIFINMKKSSYDPGETARINIEVLDDLGAPSCDAKINAKIKSSLGRMSYFSTDNGGIHYSGRCAGGDALSSSFYINYQIPPEAGLYTVELTAETSNGERSLVDNFEVKNIPPVRVEREAPINIRAGEEYSVVFNIISMEDSEAVLKEIIPANFEIIPSADNHGEKMTVTEDGYSRIISWPVSLRSGQAVRVSYSFKALSGFESLYLLGPASLDEYIEPKSWQIISSKKENLNLINNNSAHSCKVDPFSQSVKAGEKAEYQVKLTSSGENKPFFLFFPKLPPEIDISLNKNTGEAAEDVVLNVAAQPDTPKGSANLILIYQEREANGAIFGTSCQFNLVVE